MSITKRVSDMSIVEMAGFICMEIEYGDDVLWDLPDTERENLMDQINSRAKVHCSSFKTEDIFLRSIEEATISILAKARVEKTCEKYSVPLDDVLNHRELIDKVDE